MLKQVSQGALALTGAVFVAYNNDTILARADSVFDIFRPKPEDKSLRYVNLPRTYVCM